MNQITLKGKVGNAREFAGGKGVELRVATSRRIKEGDGFGWTSDWHTITCWHEDAEYAKQYGVKGAEVSVVGTYIEEVFKRQDGSEGRKHVIKPTSLAFCIPNEFRKNKGGNGGGNAYGNQQRPRGGHPGQQYGGQQMQQTQQMQQAPQQGYQQTPPSDDQINF